jgi:fucose permease
MTAILTGGRPWRWGYAIVGAWQCVLAAFFAGTNKLWSDGGAGRAGQHATHSYASTLRLPAVWLGIALFFFYTGLEQATGTWAYTLFTEARGISPATAGTSVSAYWGALTAGRILSGALASRVPADTMLRASMLGLVAGAALISLRAGAAGLLGLIVMGLSAAPIFPLLIAGTPARLGQAHAANAIGFQVGAAVLGQSVVPSSVGLLAGRRGLEAIGPCLAAAAVLLLMLFSAARRRPPAVQ